MLPSTEDMPGDQRLLLSAPPPGRRQMRLAGWVVLGLAAALAATVPFARLPLAGTGILLPAYATALLVTDLITAALLLALFSVQRAPALLVLAAGYLFAGLMAVPWALTFPGVFAPSGLLDAGLQGTAWIAALRRVGFPLFVLAYALMAPSGPYPVPSRLPVRPAILAAVAATALAALGLTWLVVAADDLLPPLMADATRVSPLWRYVPASATPLCLAGLAILWIRRRSMLDVWLMVVLCAWLIEILLLSVLGGGRFSLGWWAGRVYGLAAASIVLLVLLSETATLHARLARSMAAERRTREARLTALEALSASIAHEVNQPLASMVTNAGAALRWLDRPRPDLDEARAALARIADDGRRAASVIDGIRAMFRTGARRRVPLDLGAIVRDTLDHGGGEALLAGVTVEAALDGGLPPVLGNPVQLRQVVSNLVANAVESMAGVAGRPRLLRISAARHRSGVLVSVADTGPGLDPALRGRVFEPFFTTKAHGMGMGLMICRSIVEAHGGRLWMVDNHPHGAVFHFALPSAEATPQATEQVA